MKNRTLYWMLSLGATGILLFSGAQELLAKDRINATYRSASSPSRRNQVAQADTLLGRQSDYSQNNHRAQRLAELEAGIVDCDYINFVGEGSTKTDKVGMFNPSTLTHEWNGKDAHNRPERAVAFCVGFTQCQFDNGTVSGTLYFENVACAVEKAENGKLVCPPAKRCTLEGGQYLTADVVYISPEPKNEPTHKSGEVR